VTATGVSATGTANLTTIGSGTFAGSASLGSLAGTTVTAPFTITLSNGTLTGSLSIPVALIDSNAASGTGSDLITGGTGAHAGATGSFPSLNGAVSGSLPNLVLTFNGGGTLTMPDTAVPSITDVLDAGGYTANIAQGSIFVVKGSNLSASGFTQFSFPLPTSSGG